MKGEKIAIFEKIDSSNYNKVKDLIEKEFAIYYNEIKKNINSKNLINISEIEFDYSVTLRAMKLSHKILDNVFDKKYSKYKSINNLINLFEYPNIINMYKKEILKRLVEKYTLILKTNELSKTKEIQKCILYLKCDKGDFKYFEEVLNEKIEVKIIRESFLSKLEKFIKKITYSFYPWYLLLKKVGSVGKSVKKKEFNVGITINHPQNIFSMNYYTESILIDEKELPKEEVLFLDETSKTNIKDYKERKYNYISLKDEKENVSKKVLLDIILKKVTVAWIKNIFYLIDDIDIFKTTCKALGDYILWNIVTDNYKIKNYVKWYIPDNISKIKVLRDSGIKTWLVYPDSYTSDYHNNWGEKVRITSEFTLMDYDCVALHGDKIERYFKNNRNEIKKYEKVGLIFSQIDLDIANGKLKSKIDEFIQNKMKRITSIIGVFDTSYLTWGDYKIKDGIKFANDMLKLLEKFEDIGMIFKAKKELEKTPELIEIYEKLKNHERCIFFSRYDGTGISAPEVIAKSDLVITAAYTSTTMEAFGANKKAFFYDISGKHLGEGYYFNKFPNLVAHNYSELEKLTNYWMNKVNKKKLRDYQKKYILNEFDPYLDGKALSRLREKLRGN